MTYRASYTIENFVRLELIHMAHESSNVSNTVSTGYVVNLHKSQSENHSTEEYP